MAYKLCNKDDVECQVANLILAEGADYWMGYYDHDFILNVIESVKTYFHDIASNLVEEIRKRIDIDEYFSAAPVEPEREWVLLNLASKREREVSYEEFVRKNSIHFGWLESIFRLVLIASLCIVDAIINREKHKVEDPKELDSLEEVLD